MRRSHFGPVALVAVGALVSVRHDTPAAPVPKHLMPKEAPFLYPTRVGDRHTSTIDGITIVTVVTKVEKLDDGLLVRTEDAVDGGERTHSETAVVSARGVKVIEYAGAKLDEPFWWVKLPHGDKNEWTDRWAGENRTWRTIGWEDVEVPAGKVRALRIERGPATFTTYWFAAGMGCVKWSCGKNGREMTAFKPGG